MGKVPDLYQYKTFIFDCDGVLLNSNKVKSQAFFECVLTFGKKHATNFLNYHLANGGISRYEKFKFFQTHILCQPFDEIVHQRLLKSYAQAINSGLLSCEVATGLEVLRDRFSNASWMVISGGDQLELRDVFSLRSIDHYFDGGIFGSPNDKKEIISREVIANNIQYPAVFFGDSPYDYEASSAFNIDFVFVNDWSENKEWIELNRGLAKINSLQQISV